MTFRTRLKIVSRIGKCLFAIAAAALLASCATKADVAFAGPLQTQSASASSPNVTWVLPAEPKHKPQTDTQEEYNREHGRPLPQPELLQPTLDSALAPFTPTPGLKVNAPVRIACSDILPGLVKAWAGGFRKFHPEFSMELVKPYAGSLGAQSLIKGDVDAVFVSRELKPTDIEQFHAKYGYDPLSIAVSGGSYRHFGFLDAVVFIVNRDNPIDRLSFAQLDAILSSTHYRGDAPIRKWGDLGLGGEWKDRPISVYGIKPWNGFEEFIRQRVLSVDGKRGEWRHDAQLDSTFFPVARRIAADKAALGYTGLSAVDSSVKIIQVSVDDAGPYLAPAYEEVASADYPLARLIYLNLNRKPGGKLDPTLGEFLRFILSRNGQEIVRRHQTFLPLRAKQVEESLGHLSE